MRRLALALIMALLLAQPAVAAVSVEDVVALAVERNPTLAAAMAEMRAARHEWSAATALPNLNILFTPGVSGLGGTGEELLVSQPLGISGVPAARARVARFQSDSQRAAALVALHDLVLEVRVACFSLLRAQARLSLQREIWQVSERTLDMATLQCELGSRAEVDRAQIRLEALRARQNVVIAEATERNAVAELNALLAQAGAAAPTLEPLTATVADVEGSAILIAHALEHRPELGRALADCNAARARARLVRAEGNLELVPQFRAFSVVRGVREYGVGVAVSVPIIDYGSRRGQARAADAQALAGEARREAVLWQVEREVIQAQSLLTAARESLRVATEAAEQGRRLMEASEVGFGAGVTSVLSMLEAQRAWRQAELERIDALVALHVARARLDRATATLPETVVTRAFEPSSSTSRESSAQPRSGAQPQPAPAPAGASRKERP